MFRLYEFLAVGGFTFLSFLGVVIIKGGKRSATIVAVVVSVCLLIWNAKLEDETGRGIAGNIYCSLAHCHTPTTGPNPVNYGQGAPVTPEAATMTGTFGSAYGPVQLTPEGGSYRDNDGTLTVTGISGSVMEGRWEQRGGGYLRTVCPDQRSRGRFRFDFNGQGFLGRWSKCDGEFDQTWDGWRPKTLQFRNLCGSPVDIYLRWTDENAAWQASGPWTVDPNASGPLVVSGAAGPTPIRISSTQIFARVVEHGSGRAIWSGTQQVEVNGVPMGMQQVQATNAGTGLEIVMDCNGGNGSNVIVS